MAKSSRQQTWLPGLEEESPETTPATAAAPPAGATAPEKPALKKSRAKSDLTSGDAPAKPGPVLKRPMIISGPGPDVVPQNADALVAPIAEPVSTEPVSLAGKTVYVIDSHSLIFQVFHAIPEMTSPSGQPVNAVFGFTRDLLFLRREKKPDYLFCAFDLPGPTFRDDLYAEYKAHRDEMPDELVPQIGYIRQMVEALGVPILECERYEADDVLATVATICEAEGALCYLVTADKDCRQLISDRVKMYNVRKNMIYDAEALKADWGVRPDQVVDFQSLVGDSVDNVPGISLIGPKIASQLLGQYDTLDEVLNHASEVAGTKRRENLMNGRAAAELSRQLVRLERNVPIEVDWRASKLGLFDSRKALDLCGQFGFHRIAEEVRQLLPPPPPAEWKHDYKLVSTPEGFAQFLTVLKNQKRFSFDTETTSVHPRLAEVVGYAFGFAPGEAYYLAVRGPAGEPLLDPKETLLALKPYLEDPAIGKLGQNLKYDQIVLRSAGVELRGLEFDSMVASYLLNAGERSHNLDELALRYLNHPTITIDQLIGTGKQQKRMDEVPTQYVADYAAEDADVPVRLETLLAPQLTERGLDKLFRDVEIPLIEVLAELEFNGIRVDPARLAGMSQLFGEKLTTLEAEIYQLAGRPFNIGSPKQLQQVLFEELKLPIVRKNQTGFSTDADVLEELAPRHPLPAKILEYRQFAKLKNTYVDALPTMIHPVTGRVHASFHQAVAATGRLSSSDPNLQNIPIRTDEGREIRSAFLPGHAGWKLLCADYSQIELRVLAHFSKDETLCKAFAEDQDIHSLVAAQVHEVPLESVTPAMRREAKAVNFGVIYGQSAYGLANALGIERAAAAMFIEAYFSRYPGVDRFMEETLINARTNRFVQTILGRRREIIGVRSKLGRQRNLPERTAINTVIQGSAADLIKLAMLAIHRRLLREKLQSKMLLQIHDELVFEAPPEELPKLAALVREEMIGVWPLAVPLAVDLAAGDNWLDVESLD